MSIIDGGYRHFFVTELLQNACFFNFLATLLTIWQNGTINYISFRFNIVFLQPKKC